MAIQEGQQSVGGTDGLVKDITKLDKVIQKKEARSAELTLTQTQLTRQESMLKSRLTELEAERNSIYGRTNRFSQFKSASERDKWIKKELETIARTVEIGQTQQQNLQSEMNIERSKVEELLMLIKRTETEEEKFARDRNARQQVYRDLLQARDTALNTRKELWRAENQLETSITDIKSEVDFFQRELLTCMDRATSQGLQSIPRIAQQLGIGNRVYGPLFELFECEEVYRTAVEVIGGASLFHVVVEDDDTASRLLEVMNREKSGRVTFMPLNRLKPSHVDYPEIIEDGESQALPLVHQLKFNPQFTLALQQVTRTCKSFLPDFIFRFLGKPCWFLRWHLVQ